jgi:hypothetical protein
MSAKKELQRAILSRNVPPEILRALAKRSPGYSAQKAYGSQETLVEEIFRLLDQTTIETLCNEFPGSESFATWFFDSTDALSKSDFSRKLNSMDTALLRRGPSPDIEAEPQLYKMEV